MDCCVNHIFVENNLKEWMQSALFISVFFIQESIMDFYWHYVSKDTIDQAGKDSFLRAISVASQVFNSISEYIQVGY